MSDLARTYRLDHPESRFACCTVQSRLEDILSCTRPLSVPALPTQVPDAYSGNVASRVFATCRLHEIELLCGRFGGSRGVPWPGFHRFMCWCWYRLFAIQVQARLYSKYRVSRLSSSCPRVFLSGWTVFSRLFFGDFKPSTLQTSAMFGLQHIERHSIMLQPHLHVVLSLHNCVVCVSHPEGTFWCSPLPRASHAGRERPLRSPVSFTESLGDSCDGWASTSIAPRGEWGDVAPASAQATAMPFPWARGAIPFEGLNSWPPRTPTSGGRGPLRFASRGPIPPQDSRPDLLVPPGKPRRSASVRMFEPSSRPSPRRFSPVTPVGFPFRS
eukprot:scaffold1132_cov347-Pavlova_lutheri.AAC.4